MARLRARTFAAGGFGDDIGGQAAVDDDVVNAHIVGDVLAQIFHAGVHELHGVKRAASLLGTSGGVGGAPSETEERPFDAGVVAVGVMAVVLGVPGHGEIAFAERAFSGHEPFAGHLLFGGAAVENNGAGGAAGFQFGFQPKAGGDAADAEQIMAAAVPESGGDDRLEVGAYFLAQSGQAVILAAETDDGRAFAPDGADGRGHAVGPPFDGKTLFFQVIGGPSGGVLFRPAHFRPLPDLFRQLDQLSRVRVNGGAACFLGHFLSLFPGCSRPADCRAVSR